MDVAFGIFGLADVDLESFHALNIGVNIGVKYRCKKGSVAAAKNYTDLSKKIGSRSGFYFFWKDREISV